MKRNAPECYRIPMVWTKGATLARRLPVVLFAVAVPLFLISGSVTWAVNDLRLYEHGFDTYAVPLVTGIEKDGLMAAAREIRAYFNSTSEPLDVTVVAFGEERKLFNQREVQHMLDVKHLIWGLYVVGAVAAIYILGYAAQGFSRHRRMFLQPLLGYTLWGSGLTVALVGLVGLISLVGFDALFQFFHEVSFSNDLWQLNPRTDYLVMMFPQGFWFDATLFVAFASVGTALALAAISGSALLLRRRHERRAVQTVVQGTSTVAEL